MPWFNDVDGYFFQHTFQTPELLGMTLNLVRTSHSHPGSFILVEGLSNNSAATISSPNSPAILPGDILMEVSDGNGLWKQKDCLVEGNMHDLTMYLGRRPLVLLFWRDAPNSSGSDGSELVQTIATEKQQKEAQDKEMKETAAAQAKEDLTHATNTTTLAKQSSSLSTSLSTNLSSSLSSSSSSSSSSSPTTNTTTTKGQCVSTEGKLYGPFIHAYPIEQPNAAYPAPPPHSQLSYLQFAELQRNTNGQRCGFNLRQATTMDDRFMLHQKKEM